MIAWGTPEETERRRRIHVAVWAYAYEALDVSLVPDDVYDRESRLVDVRVHTGNHRLDRFFREHFVDYTGSWVHKHPELAKVAALTRWIIQQRT